MKRFRMSVLAVTIAMTGLAFPAVAAATPLAGALDVQGSGCGPGYWKNHPEDWVGYAPGQTVSDVFSNAGSLGSQTLSQAIAGGGGKGAAGAATILLRAAVAALLNSVHPDVDYPLTTAQVIAWVSEALTGSDSAKLELARLLEGYNSLGCTVT
jgi:hypothetical protein